MSTESTREYAANATTTGPARCGAVLPSDHPLAAAAQQRGRTAAAAAVASVTGLVPMSSVPISSAMGVAIHSAEGRSLRCTRDPPTVLGRIVEIARPPTIHIPPLFATMVRSDEPTSTVIVGQTPGELAKTLSRTNVKIGAASPQGGISKAAMGPAKPRKTAGLHSRVHEARLGEGSTHPRTPTRAPVAGPLRPRFS